MGFLFGDAVEWFIVLSVLLYLFYYYCTKTFDYWEKRNVPFSEPLPLVGNSLNFITGNRPNSFVMMDAYKRFENEKYFGVFMFRKPMLIVKDPDLIETVLIKDFSHFYNRAIHFDPKLDKLSQHLVNLRNNQWKSLRNKLTPVFSSGKLKSMHQTLINCSESLAQILDNYVSTGRPFEARDVMANFTTEVIGHCAFGLKMNALKNPDSEFRKMGKAIFQPTFTNGVRLAIRAAYPKLLSWLRWKSIPDNMEEFFTSVIREAMEAREHTKSEVQDFLQLLINLKKDDQNKIDARNENDSFDPDNELLMDDAIMAANSFVFFLAGFETTASTLAYCLFELSMNPDVQEKLRNEVTTVLSQHDGVPTFEAVKQMTYLDNIISETLRKYPPAGETSRECSKDWKMPDSDLIVKKGSVVGIPIYSLHHDPKYYPDPEQFKPERFADENKHNLTKCTFMPFGDGPRICIGKRFAEMEMKVALSTMMKKFKFTLNSKTQLPLQFYARTLLMPRGGLWINIHTVS